MLDLLRGFSKGWVAKILIALLILSFGVWGISGSLFFGNQTTVVEVGDTQVDAFEYRFAYENQVNAFSRSVGRRITQQEADALGFRQNVLNQVVAGAVLDENAREMGLGVSDENLASAIGDDPMFRDLSGNFSRSLLRNALRNAGMSENDYIESRRRVSARNQILEGTAASMSMPAVYADALARFQNSMRKFDYVTIGKEVALDIPEPTDKEVAEYYDANKTEFVAPEYRKVAILKIEPSDLTKPQDVTNDDLQSAYESRRDSLKTPERRQVQQLVLNAGTADDVKKQLSDGVSFEKIVADQGKTIADIDLGTLTLDAIPDQAVGAAAFAAELNKPTDIIEGVFGPVVVRVVKIEEATTTGFDEVKEELRNQIALERAVEDVFSAFDSIEEERGAGEALLATGEKLNYSVRTIEAIDSAGLNPDGNRVNSLPQAASLISEIFSSEPGDDTQAIELGENGFVWFEVLEVTAERQKPLDEVTSEAILAWKSSKTDEKIEDVANDIIKRVTDGDDFNTVIADILPENSLGQTQTFKTTEPLRRAGQSNEFPATAVQAGFAIGKGQMAMTDLAENNKILFRVAEIVDDSVEELDNEIVGRIDETASQDILSQVVADLQARKTVLVNEYAVELALSPGQGGQHGGY